MPQAARPPRRLRALPGLLSSPSSRPVPAVNAATERATNLRRVLLLSDGTALAISMLAATLVVPFAARTVTVAEQAIALAVTLPIALVLAHSFGLYHQSERHIDHSLAEEIGPVSTVATIWTWLLVFMTTLIAGGPLAVTWFAMFWLAFPMLVLSGRVVSRLFTRDRSWYRQRVLLLGDPLGVDRVFTRIRRHPECGLDPVGSIETIPGGLRQVSYGEDGAVSAGDVTDGRSPQATVNLVKASGVDRVVITQFDERIDERTELLRGLASLGIYVDLVTGGPETLGAGASIQHIEGLPIMTIRPTGMTRTGRFLKRAIDIAAAAAGLVVFAPLFAYTALRICIDSPGGAFFRHRRTGLDGQSFELLKFRTMVADADAQQDRLRKENGIKGELFKLANDPRITDYGAKLRSRSIDEFPQLWNVLKGDMSLVGPRPLPAAEAELIFDHFERRARVRPGITGPWQIHGRSDIPFDDMIKLDYTYVANWSFREDLRLLIRTVPAVMSGSGAY